MARPVESPPAETRERLLRAATRLFAEKGYAATAVHEITDAAGVNRALLYYYFEDKHDLYTAVVGEGTSLFLAVVDRSLSAPGSHAERLAIFVRGYLDLIWERGELGRAVHRCLLDGYQEEFGLIQAFTCGIGRLEAFFREGMAAGEFRQMNPEIAARSLTGPMFMFMLWRISEGERFAREEVAAQVTEQLLHGLLAP